MAAYTEKVVAITGASQGIGRALSLRLARQRAFLALAARDREALESVADECRALGARALAVPTDVTRESDCRKLAETVVGEWGRLDALVNNAGASMIARFDEVEDLSLFERLMRINYLGSVYPTYFALPHLKKSKGQIVAMSSLAGLTGVPTRTGYAASKHAVFGFFDSLRIELRGTGVDVTVVAPYFVRSEIHRRSAGPDGEPIGTSPMQESKIMTADKCAAAIVRAMTQRRRTLVMTVKGRLGRFVRLVAPGYIDDLAERAVREGK